MCVAIDFKFSIIFYRYQFFIGIHKILKLYITTYCVPRIRFQTPIKKYCKYLAAIFFY